jgi:uncharacterized membrane protein YedE/YeeE
MLATDFTPLNALLGGAIIGVSAVGLYLFDGRMAGITGILRRAMRPSSTSRSLQALAFLIGLTAAPVFWQFTTGTQIVQTISGNLPLLGLAGLLVGFGATIGNGCTSGHGICGLSRFSPRSLVATLTFMATAIATVYLTRHVMGI